MDFLHIFSKYLLRTKVSENIARVPRHRNIRLSFLSLSCCPFDEDDEDDEDLNFWHGRVNAVHCTGGQEGILRGPRRPKTFLHRKILLHNCTVHSGCYWPCFNGIQWAFNPLNLAKNAPNCAFPLFPLSHKEKRLLKYHDK